MPATSMPGTAPPPTIRTVGLLITFALGSAELSAEAQDLLDTLAEVIIANPSDRFVIEGHTDARGSDALNFALSERRARAALDYLAGRHGIDRSRLEARGYGRTRPIIPQDPYDGRNRRVQVGNLGS
ncbi:MAG: OmpA family protein [Alphaproteobacteria bacterium]|nr:OmpA family protein [Alphaproteobacteria bacterium]